MPMPVHSGPHTCTMHHTHTEAAQRSAVVAVTATAVEVVPGAEVQARVVLGPAIALVVEAEPVHSAEVEERRTQRYEPAGLPG